MAKSKYTTGSSKKLSPFSKKWWLVGFLVLLAVMAILELTNTTYLLHKRKAVSGTIPSTVPTAPKSTPSTGKNNDNQPSSDSQKTGATADTGAPLTAPYGTFVSNHKPTLSNDPNSPSAEQSTCNTTVGATCIITFTNSDGVVKTLPSQKTDNLGAVIWNWNVNDAGFTAGTWQIEVTATLGSQTKSTKDATPLEVLP